MLLVKFTCIEPKLRISTLNQEAYVSNIFSSLCANGYIDAVVVYCSGRTEIEQDAVQEVEQGIFCSSHVHEEKAQNGDGLIVTSSDVFTIQYKWETYKTGIQFSVYILSDSYKPSPDKEYIENLKFAIKKLVKNDWGKIEWMVDQDSECLATELYPEIFRTENQIRRMITEFMTKYYGSSWWDDFVPTDIKKKYMSRKNGYKGTAPGFSNIDDYLLSIDIGDLNTIIGYKYVRWAPTFNETVNLMINGKAEWKDGKVQEVLRSQGIVEIDFWDKHFSKYLPSNFLDLLATYEKNRNHVAHNKLLDRQAYRSIKKNTEEVKKYVSQALEKISKLIISQEERERIEEELSEQRARYEAGYEEIMESEAGVEIRHNDEIKEILENAFSQVCTDIEEEFRFREDIDIELFADSLQFTYKITNQQIILRAEMSVNDEQGATSTYEIIASEDSDFSVNLTYVNGAIYYNEEQANYCPITEDEEPDVETAVKIITAYINNKFPNLRQEVETDTYRRIKDGGEPLILSDIACEECGEFYIASDDTYAEKGTCLNCGAKHILNTCDRCGSRFLGEIEEGEPSLCENCLRIEEDQNSKMLRKQF